jgi:hypothetical protein
MVKHCCGFCRKVLRSDGTCANEECTRYVPEVVEEEETPATEEAQEKGGKKK